MEFSNTYDVPNSTVSKFTLDDIKELGKIYVEQQDGDGLSKALIKLNPFLFDEDTIVEGLASDESELLKRGLTYFPIVVSPQSWVESDMDRLLFSDDALKDLPLLVNKKDGADIELVKSVIARWRLLIGK